MTIKIKVTSKMPENSKKAFEIYESNAVRHLNRVANHFKNTVQISMVKTPKVGAVRADGHVSSVAPNPPAVDTGILSGSIAVIPASKSKLVATVSTNVNYAARLQLVYGRNFMGEGSPAEKSTSIYAERMSTDIKIGKARIT